jgi:hypothetical protein
MLALSGCSYSGDGEFTSDGLWPLVNYRLELPEFELAPGTHRFRIEGFKSHGTARVNFELRGEAERQFTQVAVPVRLRLENDQGGLLFWKEGPLNAHMQRMVRNREISWPYENEWMVNLDYKGKDAESRAVRFSLATPPNPQSACTYWGIDAVELGSGLYWIEVEVGEDPSGAGLVAQLELTSGWK